ncbi:redox-sensitive bicupin YhaK (pirin superfamily) [Paucibacter oligotrophus]|uniref:Redox-sensitive bicupin YhaK (Pirin superfamily) n=1 Tax=Roseateles oligotrophus TaxID=1769250 RepID=A0A840L1L1_9BURK|nr:pirin family protein [Roseateles oligotrophus]MBB4841776.1 redox-sensitive bicupin YhaK (pirin superfamily) [Roseateles oligotrophus]
MFELIKSCERGYADHGWLKSFHSFSFADYYEPKRMGFGALRVINEDRIAAGTGFGTHGHKDMEIISYVLNGELAHKDSIGQGQAGVIRPGEVQRMSAGKGVMHSEFNHAQDRETHFLQIWIQPEERGIPPSYEQRSFAEAQKRGQLCLLASKSGEQDSVRIHADARLYAGLFDGAEQAQLALAAGRLAYVHLIRGGLTVNGQRLSGGDALALRDEARVELSAGADAEVLVFDLAA